MGDQSDGDLRAPLTNERVSDVPFRGVVSVGSGASIRDAVATLQEHQVGCLLVVDGGTLRGIFTERDLVTRVLSQGRSLDGPLAEVLTNDPVSATTEEPLHRVLARMHEKGVRHLPLVDADGGALGTLSMKRAVHHLMDHLPRTVYNLPPEPDVYPATREGG